MKAQWEISTGKNFTPLFRGAKAEVYTLKGTDGGPQAIGQFYNEAQANFVKDAPALLRQALEYLKDAGVDKPHFIHHCETILNQI